MSMLKIEGFIEKKRSFTVGFFFQASRNSVRKRKADKMKSLTLISAIKGCHRFHLWPHKELEMRQSI